MAQVITAISLPQARFARAEEAAHALHVSRSQLYTLALEEFLRRRETKRIQEQLDAAYGDELDDDEQAFQNAALHYARRIAEADEQ